MIKTKMGKFVHPAFVLLLSVCLLVVRFISRDEAIGIWKQSGLDPLSVETIYSFSDDDHDGRLTSKEFCAGFHIIVCVT
jgi:hypothetical protein